MDASGHFLVDLTVGIVAAAAGGYLARLARLTPVLGYLAAGIAIGPFTPGITADPGSLSNLGELGLILLVFSLGLGFAPSIAAARVEQFRQHDARLLAEQHLVYDDETALIRSAKDARRELQELFEADIHAEPADAPSRRKG